MLRIIKVKRQNIYFGMAFFLFISIVSSLWGFEYMDDLQFYTAENQQRSFEPQGDMKIIIKIPQRSLEVYDSKGLFKKYRIAVGKSSTPTPIGEWNVVWKSYDWGSGFGTRWMGLNVPWGIYGIHGTNKPWSIGKFASHGCIRMRNKDVEELFEWVPIGAPVEIAGDPIKMKRILKYQMTGQDVVLLQLKLKEAGYFSGRADGIFGKITELAVMSCQKDQNIEVTGKADQQLYELLGMKN